MCAEVCVFGIKEDPFLQYTDCCASGSKHVHHHQQRHTFLIIRTQPHLRFLLFIGFRCMLKNGWGRKSTVRQCVMIQASATRVERYAIVLLFLFVYNVLVSEAFQLRTFWRTLFSSERHFFRLQLFGQKRNEFFPLDHTTRPLGVIATVWRICVNVLEFLILELILKRILVSHMNRRTLHIGAI